MASISPTQLTDLQLLAETRRVVDADRRTTAELLALLAELDTRKLYRGEGHSSLFTYCTHVLHLSEPAAYSRITAARAGRRFPTILTRLADGDVTLTTVTLLAPHLTEENHEGLLDAARHKSKRDVERLVAAIDPQPDIASSIRRQPERGAMPSVLALGHATPQHTLRRPSEPAVIAPLAPARYFVKFTVGQETHDKLKRARDLLRHAIPNGDPAAIVDRALTVLIEQLERTRHAATARPRSGPTTKRSGGRHVPAAVKRAVWARDGGRCAFAGTEGRCPETGLLEFHHVVPFALGGATSIENLELRCRSHNAYEAESSSADDSVRTELPAGSPACGRTREPFCLPPARVGVRWDMTNRIQMMVGAMAMTAALAGCARTELPTSPNLAAGGGSYTLSGAVTADDSGAAPLEAADIRLTPAGADPDDASQSRTVSTDANGGFRASGLAEGSWTITVKKSGYKDQSVVVSVKRDSTVNLSLLPAASALAAQ